MSTGRSGGRSGLVASPWRGITLAATLLPVLVLTLSPAAESNTVGDSFFCVLCGTAGLANLVRNVILFLPFGVALRLVGVDVRWAVATVLFVPAGIEGFQFLIPGRNPGAIDLWANFAGGVLGHTGGSAVSTWFARGARKSSSIAALWSFLAAALLLLTSQLFRVTVPESHLYGHHRPELAHLAEYEGRVLRATIDNVPLPGGAFAASDPVRRAIVEGTVVQAAATAAVPSEGLAPLVMITNGRYEEILLLGVQGVDLVSRVRYLADEVRFYRPDLRLGGVLESIAVGDTVVVGLDFRGEERCMSVDGDSRCDIGPYLEEGWSLLLAPTGLPAWMRRGLSFAWMFGLYFPIGLFGRRDPVTMAAFTALTMASFSGCWISTVSPPTGLGVAGMAVGCLAGASLYELLARWARDERGAWARG